MKQKFWVNHYDGADYSVSLEPDYGGACESFETFTEAKKQAIWKCRDDIRELQSTIRALKDLKKKDVVWGPFLKEAAKKLKKLNK